MDDAARRRRPVRTSVVSLAAALVLALCGLLAAPVAHAQETISTASLSGRVTDQTGAIVAGAKVTARQTETNLAGTATTDAAGRFRFASLKVGPYEVVVQKTGFAHSSDRLTLTVGAAFELTVVLSVDTVETSVNVSGQGPVLDTSRTQIAGTISQAEIKSLPMNGRNFLDLALLVPGVSPPNLGSTQLFAETSAVPGVGLSIGSQRNFSNSFIVDGLSANDDAAGLSGLPSGVDAVDQFQVVTSGGQAELGRALGGYVSVVTKSGTNWFGGTVYDYARDDRLNAPNPLIGQTLPMNQQQFGASLGGPIARDRTFYFMNVERRVLNQSGLVTISPANVAAINARLATVGYGGEPISTGVFSNPVNTTTALVKIDHQFSGKDLFNVRYNFYGADSNNSRGAGALSATTASAGLTNTDQTVAIGNTWSLTPRLVNETRGQVTHGTLAAPPSDLIGPAVSIAGVAVFGTLSGSPTARVNSMYEVADNLSYQAGAHALRGGVDFLHNDDTITFPRSVRGAYSFSSLANFLSGVYNNSGFTQTFGASVVSQANSNVGVYLQDEWQVIPGLTLNAGLRYDLQFLQTITTDTNNVSPRLGFAWSPVASRRTVVRGSAGLFYDRVPLRALANALLSAGNTADLQNLRQINVTLSPAATSQTGPGPAFPGILSAAVASSTPSNLQTMDPNLQNAYSRQASIEVEHQFGARSSVSVGYQYVRGLDLLVQINQNAIFPSASCPAGCRANPAIGNLNQYSSIAESNYHGLHVSLVHRPSRWGTYRLSYTYSKSMDDVGENFFSAPLDPTDITKDWGRSDDDQRHRLVVYGAVSTSTSPANSNWDRVTHGFQLSVMLQAYSSLPLNITTGANTLQGTAARPMVDGVFIGRNSGTGPDFMTLSLRVSRTFATGSRMKVQGLAEVFNLTNRMNPVTINGNFGTGTFPANPSPSFGQVLAVGEPRSVQIGVRVTF